MNHPSHSSALAPSAAAGSAVRCGCEAGAVVGPSGCSSLLHGAPSHQIVPVDDSPALTSVAPGLEGDHRLHEMVRACAALNRHVTPPTGFASLDEWLLTLCVTGTIRSFFALAYDGRIAASLLDNRGRERKRKLSVSPELSGFTATDAKAHALRDCKDLVDALTPMGVFQPVHGMSAAVMAKPLTGLRVFRQLGFPATLLRHAIRLCGGARVHSFFVVFARGIYNARHAIHRNALKEVKGVVERTLCFWLHYFVDNDALLDLAPPELLTMIESLRQDAIFVPLLEDCEMSLQPLIVQIVTLNMRMEQHQNRAQFPTLFVAPQPQAAIDQQAVDAAAAAASAAGSVAHHFQAPLMDRSPVAGAKRRFEPSSPSLLSVGSAQSSSSSLAPTSAASSLSRSSTPSQWYSTEDDETDSQSASQGHRVFADDDDNGALMIDVPDLNLGSGTVESFRAAAIKQTADIAEDNRDAVSNKRQRTSEPSDMCAMLAHNAPMQFATTPAVGPLASPEAAIHEQSFIPLQHQLAPSAPEMASGSDASNACASWESFLAPHLRSGASSPVDSSSASSPSSTQLDSTASFVTY